LANQVYKYLIAEAGEARRGEKVEFFRPTITAQIAMSFKQYTLKNLSPLRASPPLRLIILLIIILTYS